ncbi:transglutaminase family protein [Ectopseudomonas mendocina]|uniref:Transglutaminase family protein n=1 Tax=Ectopseudomonas mendocina TaxID=300 RepID=A0ABZ2RI46_ECTME
MDPRAACLACLERPTPALFEAALWVAAEHHPDVIPAEVLKQLNLLQLQVSHALPNAPAQELAQPLLRRLSELDFHEDDEYPIRPQAALMHRVVQRRRGQPLSLALLAIELARRLDIPLQGVSFPGHFLLRVPGADHLLDPCSGRRLYTRECRELLQRHFNAQVELSANHMRTSTPQQIIQRLSRNLRQLHLNNDEPMAALHDAERVLLLGQPSLNDYLARADIYRILECPHAEKFDVQNALLLCENASQRLELTQRLQSLKSAPALH